MPQNILIQCRNLTHRYGDLTVVDDLTLEVYSGEFVALLGESGCGKTTTLRLIGGFERPAQGTIDIAGRRVAGPAGFVAPEHRRVGMVFQEYALFPHLSVAGNVGYGLRGRVDHRERVQHMLELVGLPGLDNRMPGELSGGQQQRVALARALAPQPDVILLDEPFSNLDAGLRVRLRLELREILARASVTTIFVTHDQEEALSLADRVAVMRSGRIVQVAPPEILYRMPDTREIAEFVGEANFLEGSAEGDQAACVLGSLPLCRPASGPVDVMLRPEWVEARPNRDGEAVATQRLYFGHDQLLVVRLKNTGQMLKIRLGPDQMFRPGDSLALTVTSPAVAYPRRHPNGHKRPISALVPAGI